MNYWKLFLKLVDDGVNCFVANLLAYWYANQTSHICLPVCLFLCACMYVSMGRVAWFQMNEWMNEIALPKFRSNSEWDLPITTRKIPWNFVKSSGFALAEVCTLQVPLFYLATCSATKTEQEQWIVFVCVILRFLSLTQEHRRVHTSAKANVVQNWSPDSESRLLIRMSPKISWSLPCSRIHLS